MKLNYFHISFNLRAGLFFENFNCLLLCKNFDSICKVSSLLCWPSAVIFNIQSPGHIEICLPKKKKHRNCFVEIIYIQISIKNEFSGKNHHGRLKIKFIEPNISPKLSLVWIAFEQNLKKKKRKESKCAFLVIFAKKVKKTKHYHPAWTLFVDNDIWETVPFIH